MPSTSLAPRIPVKKAVRSALEYMQQFTDIFPNQSTARLEATEFDDKNSEWRIVISYGINPLDDEERLDKLFRIDAETGDVIAMRRA